MYVIPMLDGLGSRVHLGVDASIDVRNPDLAKLLAFKLPTLNHSRLILALLELQETERQRMFR